MLLVGVLLATGVARGLDREPAERPARSRSESFVLFERGRVWGAERAQLGSARSTATFRGSECELELTLALDPIATQVQRVLRRRGPETTLIWREWRSGDADGGASSGRTLVLERGPRGSHLREWAGRAMRAERTAHGTSTLELVEHAREVRGFGLSVVRRFDPLEAELRPALVLATPIFWGFPGGPRCLDVIDLGSGMRPSRWILVGSELIAFAEGGLVGSRCAENPEQPLFARATDL